MTKDNINKYWHLLEALKADKEIQIYEDDRWQRLDNIIFFAPASAYRIVEPPQPPKYRPWTQDECPLGAWVKAKDTTTWSLIIGSNQFGFHTCYGHNQGFKFAVNHFFHSLDKGVTWFPCGVKE